MKKKTSEQTLTQHRLTFSVLHALRGLKPSEIAKASSESKVTVSASTVRKWRKHPRDGGTKFPQAAKLDTALSAVGLQLGIVKKE